MTAKLAATSAVLEQSDLAALAGHTDALAAFLPATAVGDRYLEQLQTAETQAVAKLSRTVETQQ
ncbi:hypothetical protein ACIQGZ_03065 [Streptomyces sp. NPDC092296]|uniref:hypothetical protein n=1 Tax=Streptomyces sp. NPDC092296 TaxID=3366012 RepID=UPI00380D16AD